MLAIYLNDHLAAATGARELARRAAASNRGSAYGRLLAQVAEEIDQDRQSLLELMRGLGIGVDRLKLAAGWGAEKVGRLKLNGHLLSYSPLSRVIELEALWLGVQGKLGLWRSLRELDLDGVDPARLATLIARGEEQAAGLDQHRLRAVSEALS